MLLYAEDDSSPAKQRLAEKLVRQLTDAQSGHVSMQVLQEYYSTATRKLRLSADIATLKIQAYMRWHVVTLQPNDLLIAIDLQQRYQFSIWDALIIRAAMISNCEILYSEDMQAGQRIDGLTIVNPF
ncbi:MAG TPA: PIN domain-containing protein [Thermoanaerobaculia bacterium]